MGETRGHRKRREGVVVSNKMDKTAVVSVVRFVKDRTVGKYIRRTKKYYADDRENKCKVGDVVRIVESKPLSKLKRWSVEKIVAHKEGVVD